MRTPLLFIACFACNPQYVAPPATMESPDRVGEGELERGMEVLFAPNDDLQSAELAQIEKVVEAAATSPWDGEGSNPYSIHYAVYNLRNAAIVEALADAADAGVRVQILTEADQLDPERTWNTADERLAERGFWVVSDHRELTEEQLQSADMIGIAGSGLMHLKTRIFQTPESSWVVSGSMNPGDNALLNDETWHLITDEALVKRYQAAYSAVLADVNIPNTWDDHSSINVLFGPESEGPAASTKILDWLATEEEQIMLMVYSLRDFGAPGHTQRLLEVLAERIEAGVPVVLITDRKQSDAWGDSTAERLRDIGATVYEVTNSSTEYTAMHAKLAVLGRSEIRVISDAANWSKAALGSESSLPSNTESTLFIQDQALGKRSLAQFMSVLEKYAEQGAADGEPSFETTAGELLAAPNWPTSRVHFVAHDAHTVWGETIYVVGDAAALGAWSPSHALVTDNELYPAWVSDEPVELPVGTSFSFKLLAEKEGGKLRWEEGENQHGFVQLPPFRASQTVETTWR